MNRKLIFWVMACAFCIAPRVYAETIVEGDIVTDTVWTKEGSPYVLNSIITIATSSTLSVDAGVVVTLAEPSGRFRVLGTLSMRGTVDDEIHLQSLGTYSPRVHTFGGSMYLRHVKVSGLYDLYAGDQGRIVLDHVMLAGTGVGIYDSSLEALSSSFSNARSNAINVFVEKGTSSTALIRNSSISGSRNYGLYVSPGAVVDARHNFWGDASGLKHFQYNKLGKGDKTYGIFEFSPWLTADPFACCSSVLFLPGLSASRLYVADGDDSATATPSGENRLWEPNRDADIEALRLIASGASVNPVYAKESDVIDEAYVSLAGPNIYKSFISDIDVLVATGTIHDWVPVAYDWRLSLDQLLEKGSVATMDASSSLSSARAISYVDATSTPYIIQEFDRLARESKTGRVSIVAHSNGGLVAKALALRLEERGDASLIDKIIFVAVPQTGTPHAIGALLHGFKEGIPFFASAQAMRRLGQNMPSAYNLLPSARYIAFDSRPIITFSATTSSSSLRDLRDAYGSGIGPFPSFIEFLKGSEGRKTPAYADLSLPEKLSGRLLSDASLAHETLDVWTPSPSSELFQIAGKGLDTVSGIEYYEGKKGKKPVLLYKPTLASDGDGTVVSQSAWMIPDGPNVSKYWVDLKAASKGLSRNRSHADMLEVKDLRDFIVEILSELPHAIRRRAQVSPAVVIPPKDSQKKIRVFVHSPDVSVSAGDAQGNHTGISGLTGLVETQIPDSEYREFGDVTYVSVPDGQAIVSPAGEEGLATTSITIDIDEVIADDVATSSTYGDIAIGTSSVIVIDIVATTTESGATSTVPTVGIDDEGDGVIDREVMPDSSQDEPTLEVPVEPLPNPAPEDVSSSGTGSRSGGTRRVVVIESDAPVQTEPFIVATTGPVANIPATPPIPAVAHIATTSSPSSSFTSSSTHAFATESIPSIDQNIAGVYGVGQGISPLFLILAVLIALAILWFLSCKISKSE